MGYGNGAIQQSATRYTHTHIHSRHLVFGYSRLDAWCTESLENTLWLLSEKQTQNAAAYGENIYVNVAMLREDIGWNGREEKARERGSGARERNTKCRITLHTGETSFLGSSIVAIAASIVWTPDIVVLVGAQYSAKNANGCDKMLCSFMRFGEKEQESWQTNIFYFRYERKILLSKCSVGAGVRCVAGDRKFLILGSKFEIQWAIECIDGARCIDVQHQAGICLAHTHMTPCIKSCIFRRNKNSNYIYLHCPIFHYAANDVIVSFFLPWRVNMFRQNE